MKPKLKRTRITLDLVWRADEMRTDPAKWDWAMLVGPDDGESVVVVQSKTEDVR